jgi:Fe-S cluster biogenesis protein NfuA
MFLGILPFRDGNLICEVKRMSETVQRKVEKALDEIRPNIQADGGDVQLVAVEKGIVKVRLQGHCVGCPMSALTLKQGIEAHIKRRVPEVVKVESIQ